MSKMLFFLLIFCFEFHCKTQSIHKSERVSSDRAQIRKPCTDPSWREHIRSNFGLEVSANNQDLSCGALKDLGISWEELANEIERKKNSEPQLALSDDSTNELALVDYNALKDPTTEISVIAGIIAAPILLGAATYLSKPIKPSEDQKRITEAIDTYKEKPAKLDATNAKTRYDTLQSLWDKVYDLNTPESWDLKAQILDEVDDLVANHSSQNPDIKHFEFKKYPTYMTHNPAKVFTPLVDYHHLSEVTKLPEMNKEQFIAALQQKGLLVQETSKTSALLESMYGKEWSIAKLARKDLVLRTMTGFMGDHTRKPLSSVPDTRALQIAKFSVDLGISPGEVVTGKDGKRVFRGCKFLFGASTREIPTSTPGKAYTDNNAWFIRDLTPEARAAYMAYSTVGPDGKAVASDDVFVSVADARVRMTTLDKEHLDIRQNIVGKALSPEAENEARARGEDPRYLSQTYNFTVKDLLAVDDNVSPLPEVYSQDNSPVIQRHYLNTVHQYMQGEAWNQAIHRLAPADVHNYVAGSGGKVLSPAQALEYFEQQMQGATEAKKQEISKLKELFQADTKPQATTDIYGGNMSVATHAVRHDASILAQNDRKIMLIKGKGEDVSVYVFIGATGVNQVGVNESIRTVEPGANMGNMAFGDESSQGKLRNPGDALGGFDKRGSTVIVYTNRKYWDIEPKVKGFLDKNARFKEQIEFKTPTGAPLFRRIR